MAVQSASETNGRLTSRSSSGDSGVPGGSPSVDPHPATVATPPAAKNGGAAARARGRGGPPRGGDRHAAAVLALVGVLLRCMDQGDDERVLPGRVDLDATDDAGDE